MTMFCGYETYELYLRSPEWDKKRREALEEGGNRCCVCGGTDSLQVHHLSYRELGGVDISPVRVLCKACHEKVHASSEYIKGRYGMVLDALMSAVLADTMAVLWKGRIPPGSTTRLKGILLSEVERTFSWSGHDAPAFYKAHHSDNRPDAHFNNLIETATKVWNLDNGEST